MLSLYFNVIEAGFWIVIGLGFAVAALRASSKRRTRCLQATVTLVAFGISDIVECYTGAWWRPWWLFAWKALCVAVLFALLFEYWQRKRAPNS